MATLKLQTVRGHAVAVSGLGPGAVVVDGGAHRGEFSRWFMDHAGARCHLVEVNPGLAERLGEDGFPHVLHAALSAHDGHANFIQRSNPEAGGIMERQLDEGNESVSVETITLGTLMRRFQLERIHLLKLDIEGAEFELLETLPDDVLQSIDQITVEFHDFLPEFRGRGLYENVRSRLERSGFLVCSMAFRTHGDVLLLNRRALGIGAIQAFYLSRLARFVERLKLIARKK